MEGHHVRVTGQDVQRGTFAHRHAVLHDQKTDEPYTPLDNLSQDQARFSIANSPLSEYAPIGFEYGFTLADPTSLAFWEAQFGDFTNNMQVVIDNLIATAEAKWMDRSGVVLSLPHGYDGQGPEHSSARLERYLMLGNEAASWPADMDRQHQDCNLQVVYITSPANYFHVLRRQIQREFRKRE
jgi:2-oxoglutarate dehydrogenase E1 component